MTKNVSNHSVSIQSSAQINHWQLDVVATMQVTSRKVAHAVAIRLEMQNFRFTTVLCQFWLGAESWHSWAESIHLLKPHIEWTKSWKSSSCDSRRCARCRLIFEVFSFRLRRVPKAGGSTITPKTLLAACGTWDLLVHHVTIAAPYPGGSRSAASCLCTVRRRALHHYATRSPTVARAMKSVKHRKLSCHCPAPKKDLARLQQNMPTTGTHSRRCPARALEPSQGWWQTKHTWEDSESSLSAVSSLSFHLSSAFTPRFTFQHLLTRCDKTASCWLWDRIHASVRHAICDLEAPGWFPHLLPGSQIVVWHFVVCCFAFVSHCHTNLCNDLAKTMRWTEKTFSWRRLWYTGRTVQAGINIYELTFHATLTPVCLNSAVMHRTCPSNFDDAATLRLR